MVGMEHPELTPADPAVVVARVRALAEFYHQYAVDELAKANTLVGVTTLHVEAKMRAREAQAHADDLMAILDGRNLPKWASQTTQTDTSKPSSA